MSVDCMLCAWNSEESSSEAGGDADDMVEVLMPWKELSVRISSTSSMRIFLFAGSPANVDSEPVLAAVAAHRERWWGLYNKGEISYVPCLAGADPVLLEK